MSDRIAPQGGAVNWRLAGVVVLPFAAAYFMSLTFRLINAVIAPDLVKELELSASQLGFLTSTYFLTFAIFQLPLGVMLDRYGARRVQTVTVLTAAAGSALFAVGDDLMVLALGRGLIGLGVALGLMAGYKQIADWFPADRIPLLNGLFMGLGSLGALIATVPAQILVNAVGWRGLMLTLAVITAAAALSIFLIVPERNSGTGATESLTDQIKSLRVAFSDRLFWQAAPITIAAFGIGHSIQGLWVAPWLRDVAGFDRAAIADQLLLMALALSIGSLMGGVLADWARRFGVGALDIAWLSSLIMMVMLLGVVLEWIAVAPILWVAFSASVNPVTLTFAALTQHFPRAYAGRANGGLNLLAALGSFVCQFGIGAVIDLWPPLAAGGYAPEAYRWAFGAALAFEVMALAWFVLMRARA